MAMLNARLWWLTIAVLLWTPSTQCRNITNQDIREVMLSLVQMMRMSDDKLERHEFRERGLGEQLKKMLAGLEKRHRALEPIKGTISRLDERLSNVETILLQKDERENKTQKKITEALDGIQKSIQALTLTVTQSIKPKDDIENNLTTNDDTVDRRLDVTDAKLDAVKLEIEKLKKSLSKDNLRAMCLDLASDVNPLEKHISEAEKLLNRYELKLNEYNGTASKVQTDFVPLSEVALADDAWHSKMSEVMERQEKDVKKIQRLLSDAESMWKDLPRIADLREATNRTLDAVSKATELIKENDETSVAKVTTKIKEMSDRLSTTNEDIQNSLTQGNTMTERVFGDITRSYEALKTEVQALRKSENVMLQTADNVIATKKRIEYGIQQIRMDVAELIKVQAKDMNKTLSERFEDIEASITGNHATGVGNITSKIESEMSQVWRQIGIMHQQLLASKVVLDKLNIQAEDYVNSSSSTINKVKEEVGGISVRIAELSTNLNYVLGRLSLVTQEFGEISTGLFATLGNLKTSSESTKPNEGVTGPGPHNITNPAP